MSTKPRQNQLCKAYIRIIEKDRIKKKSKPWDKRKVAKENDVFSEVNQRDIMVGFKNVTNAKHFARHKFMQGME